MTHTYCTAAHLRTGAEHDPRILERLAAQASLLTLSEGETRAVGFRIVDRT